MLDAVKEWALGHEEGAASMGAGMLGHAAATHATKAAAREAQRVMFRGFCVAARDQSNRRQKTSSSGNRTGC